MWRPLVDRFRLIDAPQAGPPDPAAGAGYFDPAPVAGAGTNLAHHFRLQLGHDFSRGSRCLVEAGGLRGNDEAALAGQQALVNPAAGALPIADFPPVFVLGDDFDGHCLALEDPIDRIAGAWTRADIDLVRPQGGETRDRQSGPFALGHRRLVRGVGIGPEERQCMQTKGCKDAKGHAKRDRRSNSHWELYTSNLHIRRQALEKARFSAASNIQPPCWTRRARTW